MPEADAVLVTGCAGFIGSHLSQALLQRGQQVIGLDNFDPYYPRAAKERNLSLVRQIADFPFIEGDIRDAELLGRIMAEHRPTAVVHIAALAGVRPSVLAPARYMDVNVTGTSCLLEAARQAGVNRFVLASSSSVYGGGNQAPFCEDQPTTSPLSPYAASKIAAEACAHAFHHLYGLPIVALRFFTVYGPRQRPDLAIRKFTENILAGKPIQLFGDGSSSRDYTFVDDTVRGIIAALDSKVDWSVVNLGGAHPVTLHELVEALQRALGKEAIIERLPMQPGDMLITCADVRKARAVLGWEAQVSLDEGLRRFAEWHKAAMVKAE
jgi:UDP-glucuronate 4-epimerase